MTIHLERLCRKLNYQFKNPRLLNQALTHCSFGKLNNERLEFLGDSILGYSIAQELYQRFPNHSEGFLSRSRAALVNGSMLAEIAAGLQLGDSIILAAGEYKSGGYRRESILADALEAIFAAIALDSDFESAKTVILGLYQDKFAEELLIAKQKDPKTQLQEQLQASKQRLPIYHLEKIEGEEHEQRFFIRCEIPGFKEKTQGEGNTRRRAEQEAAEKMLAIIDK